MGRLRLFAAEKVARWLLVARGGSIASAASSALSSFSAPSTMHCVTFALCMNYKGPAGEHNCQGIGGSVLSERSSRTQWRSVGAHCALYANNATCFRK